MTTDTVNRRRFVASASLALLNLVGSGRGVVAQTGHPAAIMRGVNLESGGWGWWPPLGFYDYYLEKGFTVFRLCFNWSQLQPKIGGPYNADWLTQQDAVIQKLTSSGASVILDQHDYMRRDDLIIGASSVTSEQYADLWRWIANRYKANTRVLFGLMNEPHDLDSPTLAKSLNAAIAAIRDSGASNAILCPGNDWCSGQRWLKSGNDRLADLIAHDPSLYFEVHQYLDAWGAGQKPMAERGSGGRLDDVTRWAKRTKRKLFLGEFSAGVDDDTLEELRRLLMTLKDNPDVWVGYCYWSSGGGKTGDRWYSLDPVEGRDRPQMQLLLSI